MNDLHKWPFNAQSVSYVIVSLREYDTETEEPLYWSNEDGWVSRDTATVFESTNYELPYGGQWEAK